MKQFYLENEYAEYWVENGILVQVFKPNVVNITYEIAYKIVEDRLKVSNKVWRPIFVDLNKARSVDKKARDYFAEAASTKYLSIAALQLHSYTAWLGGKLFLAFSKPGVKTELFKSKIAALDWLKQFVNTPGPIA